MKSNYYLITYVNKMGIQLQTEKKQPYSSTQTAIKINENLIVFRELFFYNYELENAEIEYYLNSLKYFNPWLCFCPESLKKKFEENIKNILFPNYEWVYSKEFVSNDFTDAIKNFSVVEIQNLLEDGSQLSTVTQFELDSDTGKLRSNPIQDTIMSQSSETISLLERLKKFQENIPLATVATVGTKTEIFKAEDERPYDSDINNPILMRNVRGFNIVGAGMLTNIFGSKLKAIFSFTSNKSTSILYDDLEKYVIITPIAKDQELVNLDFLLNNIYCDDSSSVKENIEESVLFSIRDNKIKKQMKSKYNEREIKRLFWSNLRTVDLQLTGIMSSSKTIAKVTAYCILLENTLIYFKTDGKARWLFILDYTQNMILPLSELKMEPKKPQQLFKRLLK